MFAGDGSLVGGGGREIGKRRFRRRGPVGVGRSGKDEGREREYKSRL